MLERLHSVGSGTLHCLGLATVQVSHSEPIISVISISIECASCHDMRFALMCCWRMTDGWMWRCYWLKRPWIYFDGCMVDLDVDVMDGC